MLSAASGFRRISTIFRSSNVIALQKHTLPDLPYDFGALEPVISADIMKCHYQKHHATYVNNLNIAEEQLAEAIHKNDVTKMIALQVIICVSVFNFLQPALRFNGGGHINHSIFWNNLSPNGGGEPEGPLAEAIKRDFGSFAAFKEKMTNASVSVQGSGWGWLGLEPGSGKLRIAACPNQDPLEGTTGIKSFFEFIYFKQFVNRSKFLLMFRFKTPTRN